MRIAFENKNINLMSTSYSKQIIFFFNYVFRCIEIISYKRNAHMRQLISPTFPSVDMTLFCGTYLSKEHCNCMLFVRYAG